ncbi:MAG: NAD-dependent dehydratase, partial [Mesorhizobium sp.]
QEQVEAFTSQGIQTVRGDLVAMSVDDLAAAMRGCDAIVFSAGAGGTESDAATSQVDGDGPGKLAAAAKRAGVRRFLLVSVFPEAWRERRMDDSFEHYMVEKKKAETQLVLTDLDWLILRPSALTNEPGTGEVDLGLAKVHTEIPRDDVAATVIALLRAPALSRLILEVTGGTVAISVAIEALSDAAA